MRIRLGIILLLILCIFSCGSQKEVNTPSLNGIWKSLGSAWILEIQDSASYSFYDITSISCLASRQGTISEVLESLSLEKDTLTLLKGITPYKFVRIEKLPELCGKVLSEKKLKDPQYNFEVFAETVRDHYAFLALNKLEWDELYQEQKEKLNANATDAQLYLVMEETLEKMRDNHAFLEAPDDVYAAVEKLREAPEENLTDPELPEYGDFQVAQMVVEHHLQEEMTQDSWLIQWGKLTNDIGYIQIKAMWLYADLAIPQALTEKLGYVDAYVETFHKMYEGEYIKKEVSQVRKIMDKVMRDLAETNSMVIDLRFNGGGQDAVSFEILSRFISQDTQVGTQKLRYKNSFSPAQAYIIPGTKGAYLKPVYVLTSPQTGSAAESFAMATRAILHANRIGAATMGATSTALEKTLPNGWAFSISNEICTDNQSNNFENVGVPVDYKLDYSRDRQVFFRSVVNNLALDKVQILKAIETLSNNE